MFSLLIFIAETKVVLVQNFFLFIFVFLTWMSFETFMQNLIYVNVTLTALFYEMHISLS